MITPQVVKPQEKVLTEDQVRLLNYIEEMSVELGDLAEAGGLLSLSQSLHDITRMAQSHR